MVADPASALNKHAEDHSSRKQAGRHSFQGGLGRGYAALQNNLWSKILQVDSNDPQPNDPPHPERPTSPPRDTPQHPNLKQDRVGIRDFARWAAKQRRGASMGPHTVTSFLWYYGALILQDAITRLLAASGLARIGSLVGGGVCIVYGAGGDLVRGCRQLVLYGSSTWQPTDPLAEVARGLHPKKPKPKLIPPPPPGSE